VPLPDPNPGLVIRYAYLWREQSGSGKEEGAKDRPCVIVLAVEDRDGERLVTVAPITHSPPRNLDEGLEIPMATKRRLGLDDKPSWIVSTEVNRFTWPGPDLRPVSRERPDVFTFGLLPRALMERLRAQILARGRLGIVPRRE
jgi:hypothetical protein